MKNLKILLGAVSIILFAACSNASGGGGGKGPKLTVQTNGKKPFIIIQNPTQTNQALISDSSNSIFSVQEYINEMQAQGKNVYIPNDVKNFEVAPEALLSFNNKNRFYRNNAEVADLDNDLSLEDTHNFHADNAAAEVSFTLKASGAHCNVWFITDTQNSITFNNNDKFNTVVMTFCLLFYHFHHSFFCFSASYYD